LFEVLLMLTLRGRGRRARKSPKLWCRSGHCQNDTCMPPSRCRYLCAVSKLCKKVC